MFAALSAITGEIVTYGLATLLLGTCWKGMDSRGGDEVCLMKSPAQLLFFRLHHSPVQ